MSYASKLGHARVSVRNVQAAAICDRCGRVFNHVDLRWQNEWRGATLQNIRILVCQDCLDIPQENIRSIVLPADPTPIINARVQDFDLAESDYRSLSAPTVTDPITGIPIPNTTLRVTEDCQNRGVRPFGVPTGLIQNAVMPYDGAANVALGRPLQILSVISNGTATVQVTCSAPHNLVPLPLNTYEGSVLMDPQVSIEGLANNAANGFYSVTLLGATTFTYMTYGSIPAAALLTPTTRIITALVGLPRGYKRIPKIEGGALSAQPGTLEYLFELESSLGAILLEDGVNFLELETGP